MDTHFMAARGPELDLFNLSVECEREIVSRVMSGNYPAFFEEVDGFELASACTAALKESGTDADLRWGTFTLRLSRLAEEYAERTVAQWDKDGDTEDEARKLGVLETD